MLVNESLLNEKMNEEIKKKKRKNTATKAARQNENQRKIK